MPAHARGMLGFVVSAYNAEKTLVLVEYVAAKYSDFDSLRSDPTVRVRFDKALTRKDQFRDAARTAGFSSADLEKWEKAFVKVQ